MALGEQLVTADPKNTGLQNDLVAYYQMLGNVLRQSGKLAAANARYEQAGRLARNERRNQTTPQSDPNFCGGLGAGLEWLGRGWRFGRYSLRARCLARCSAIQSRAPFLSRQTGSET